VDVISFERGGQEDNICLTYVIKILFFVTILLTRTRCLVGKTKFVVKLTVGVKPRLWMTYVEAVNLITGTGDDPNIGYDRRVGTYNYMDVVIHQGIKAVCTHCIGWPVSR